MESYPFRGIASLRLVTYLKYITLHLTLIQLNIGYGLLFPNRSQFVSDIACLTTSSSTVRPTAGAMTMFETMASYTENC